MTLRFIKDAAQYKIIEIHTNFVINTYVCDRYSAADGKAHGKVVSTN